MINIDNVTKEIIKQIDEQKIRNVKFGMINVNVKLTKENTINVWCNEDTENNYYMVLIKEGYSDSYLGESLLDFQYGTLTDDIKELKEAINIIMTKFNNKMEVV